VWLASWHYQPGGRRPLPLDRTEQGRGEKRAREREKRPEFKLNFLTISNRNLKNYKQESCREFENLQLLFYPKVHLSHGLKVILNSELL
jgi:hypothetical protein